MSRLVIYGAGGFGREIWGMEQERRDVVFCDDAQTGTLLGAAIIPPSEIKPDDELFVALADPVSRRRVVERFAGMRFASIHAPTAIIAPTVEVGEGSFFCHYTHASVSAQIGRQLLCHVYAYIGHENVIGDFVTVGPRASLNGNITVGDGAYIGAGAIIRQGITIGAGSTVGMGAVVTKDVPPAATVIGNPARAMARPVRRVA